jgi:hypothetical protein
MAALTAITPTAAGTTSTGAGVSSSDTISNSITGTRGAYLEIINGGASPDTVAISDSGASDAGNPATSSGGTVANGTSKVFFISPYAFNASTGNVTVTHTFTTTVTYKLYPLG